MYIFNKLIIWFLPLIPKPIVSLFSKPYVAGAKLEDAMHIIEGLNQKGMCATMDVLGESAKKQEECEEAVAEYLKVLDVIEQKKLDCNISVKLTQLGLLLGTELCYQNIRKIVAKADSFGIFVRIDMEDASVTSDTIDIFLRINQEFRKTGIVLQAYLRRTLDDLKKMAAIKTNFRICKGIYVESRAIAYKDADTINNNFAFLLHLAFEYGCYAGIATHDEKLVWQSLRLVEVLGLSKEDYEFQMLLGVDEELRDIIVAAGHRLRVYVPYGKRWYAYVVRRLKENPKIALYVLKALLHTKG